MTMKNELHDLQQQQREELANLHRVYVHTKREVGRKLSPDRFVRRHLGATIGVATLAGFLLAPRPGPRRQTAVEATTPKGRPDGNSLSQLLKKILGPLAAMSGKAPASPAAPTGAPHATNGHSPSNGAASKMSGLLPTLLTMLAGRIDIHRLVSELMRMLVQKFHEGATAKQQHVEPPHVSSADVGTVKPDQFETDF